MSRAIHIASCKTIVWTAIVLSCLGTMTSTACAVPLRIVYPGPSSTVDKRSGYYVQLIDLALSKSDIRFELRPYTLRLVGPRVFQIVAANEGIDITWAPTTHDLERTLLPIRIPIDKGILGWRLFLIKQSDRRLFADIHSLEQLRKISAGQQRDWSDTTILRENGLTVVGANVYDGLFQMLAANRFQYLPRGVAEIWGEEKAHADLGLEVEQTLALHYPTGTYFFVRKGNEKLAKLIEQGLRTAMSDGSFDKLFEQFNGELIKRAHLNTRTVFELNNPLLPNATLLQQREYSIHQ